MRKSQWKAWERPRIKCPLAMLVAAAVLAANVSCSRFVRVPADEYESIDASDAPHWRVQMEDGRTYAVTRFSVTDSTVVIEEFYRSGKTVADPDSLTMNGPVVLERDDVASIEKWAQVKKSSSILVGTVLVVAVAGLLTIWVATQALKGLEE